MCNNYFIEKVFYSLKKYTHKKLTFNNIKCLSCKEKFLDIKRRKYDP